MEDLMVAAFVVVALTSWVSNSWVVGWVGSSRHGSRRGGIMSTGMKAPNDGNFQIQEKRQVQQYKHERECSSVIGQLQEDKIARLENLMDGVLSAEEFVDEELRSLANKHELCDLYENDAIFDKFECCLSGDGQRVAGSYSHLFRVFGCSEGSTRIPQGKKLGRPSIA